MIRYDCINLFYKMKYDNYLKKGNVLTQGENTREESTEEQYEIKQQRDILNSKSYYIPQQWNELISDQSGNLFPDWFGTLACLICDLP